MISSGPEIPSMQASKWLQVQALLDVNEMRKLFSELENVQIFLAGHVTDAGKGKISKEEFLQHYEQYIALLKKGEIPNPAMFRAIFSATLTLAEDHLFLIKVGESKELLRVAKPVVQLQLHTIGYSPLEKKFRPMIMGKDSIHWGVQFSYPQLYMDPDSKQIEKITDEQRFPNTSLFRTIQRWMRKHTVPTPFLIEEQKINVPMRLGLECFAWINRHPQLQALGIKISTKGEKA